MLRAPLWDSIPVANYIRLNRGSVLERGKGNNIRCVLFLITKPNLVYAYSSQLWKIKLHSLPTRTFFFVN